MSGLKVSVIVVNWNSRDDLAGCLDSLRVQTERSFEAIVVDNQHPDRTNSTGVLMFADTTAYDRGFDAPVSDDEQDEEAFCASAGAALYRRTMSDQVCPESGVFDRTFFMYFEDVHLGWRCRLAGWSAIYAPAAARR